MFYLANIERDILISPRFFTKGLKDRLTRNLREKVEGSCIGRWGYIIKITRIDSIGDGRLFEGKGYATFTMKFKAIAFKPIRGEVLDAVVTEARRAAPPQPARARPLPPPPNPAPPRPHAPSTLGGAHARGFRRR